MIKKNKSSILKSNKRMWFLYCPILSASVRHGTNLFILAWNVFVRICQARKLNLTISIGSEAKSPWQSRLSFEERYRCQCVVCSTGQCWKWEGQQTREFKVAACLFVKIFLHPPLVTKLRLPGHDLWKFQCCYNIRIDLLCAYCFSRTCDRACYIQYCTCFVAASEKIRSRWVRCTFSSSYAGRTRPLRSGLSILLIRFEI